MFIFRILVNFIYVIIKLIYASLKRFLLFIFITLYQIVSEIKSILFDLKILPSYNPKVFTLVIGNIYSGGSGKSPFVKFLVEKLQKRYKIAVLSRGYGRTTSFLIEVNQKNTVEEVGDEVKDFFDEFGSEILILCSISRKKGIQYIEENHKNINLIIMDDGFQHRWVKPHFSIVLESENKIGLKREFKYRQNRADLFIQTKVNYLSKKNESKFDFRTSLQYSFANSLKRDLILKNNIQNAVLITGIAENASLANYLSAYFTIDTIFEFKDHKNYGRLDIEEVLNFVDYKLITTTKDWVKIKELVSVAEAKRFIIVKCKVDFKEKESEFLEILTTKIDTYYDNSVKKP